jgi:hypothetical protein
MILVARASPGGLDLGKSVRKVIDSNFLQTDALKAYLSASSTNYAVLTEYAAMEAYKQDAVASICSRMETLCQFPAQVVILKGALLACGLSGRKAVSLADLIDQEQTREFPDFCRRLVATKSGDRELQRQINEYGREAKAIIDRMLLGAQTLSDGIELFEKTFTPAELKILRRREHYTPQMREKLIDFVLRLTGEFTKQHPYASEIRRGPQIRNTFIFRFALCGYVSILKRVEEGGVGNVNVEKLRNDLIDVNFAAFATYFDGFLTDDKRAHSIYDHAAFLLQDVFPMPPWWARILIATLPQRLDGIAK